MFGGILPENFYQNQNSGDSNMISAKVAHYEFYMNRGVFEMIDWEERLSELVQSFNAQSQYVYVGVYNWNYFPPQFDSIY